PPRAGTCCRRVNQIVNRGGPWRWGRASFLCQLLCKARTPPAVSRNRLSTANLAAGERVMRHNGASSATKPTQMQHNDRTPYLYSLSVVTLPGRPYAEACNPKRSRVLEDG